MTEGFQVDPSRSVRLSGCLFVCVGVVVVECLLSINAPPAPFSPLTACVMAETARAGLMKGSSRRLDE